MGGGACRWHGLEQKAIKRLRKHKRSRVAQAAFSWYTGSEMESDRTQRQLIRKHNRKPGREAE